MNQSVINSLDHVILPMLVERLLILFPVYIIHFKIYLKHIYKILLFEGDLKEKDSEGERGVITECFILYIKWNSAKCSN